MDRIALPENFVSLLLGIQQMFNEALSAEPALSSHGIRLHFDYIDSDEVNALAFREAEYLFIGVTVPAVLDAWRACSSLAASARTVELLGLDDTLATREGLAAVLLRIQLNYVVCHEYAHHLNGDVSNGEFFEEYHAAHAGNILSQAREVHADGIAVYLVMANILASDERDRIISLLEIASRNEQSQDQILVALALLAIGGRMYNREPQSLNESNVYLLTHPPQAARMNNATNTIWTWCSQNLPDVAGWLTIERF